MKLTNEQVLHIAKLARLELTEAQVEKFGGQLSDIFNYFEILSEVDTEGVEPTAQVTGLTDVTSKDTVRRFDDIDGLLSQSFHPTQDHQVMVKKVI